MSVEYYTAKDYWPSSPGLVAVPYTKIQQPAPPPLSLDKKEQPESSSDSERATDSKKGRKRKKGRSKQPVAQPSQGDFVLIRHLDPNRLDIASQAREPLPASTDEEDQSSGSDGEGSTIIATEANRVGAVVPSASTSMEAPPLASLPGPTSTLLNGRISRDMTIPRMIPRSSKKLVPALQPSPDITSRKNGKLKLKRELDDAGGLPIKLLDGMLHESQIDAAGSLMQLSEGSPKDKLASSPKLQPLMIDPAHIPAPVRLHGIHCPSTEVAELRVSPKQQLPSIGPLLRETTGGSVEREMPPTMPRARTASTTSYDGLSPAAIHNAFKQGGRSPGQHSRASVSASTPSTGLNELTPSDRLSQSVASPADSHAAHAPSLRFTPSTITSASSASPSNPRVFSGSDIGIPSAHATPGEVHMQTKEASPDSQRPTSGGGPTQFKCTEPGCISPPFSTQYLLNSHMNVHSDVRQHYCPEKGCSRAIGGVGFKRKNEMIRHRLVHKSPGYECPFCPDRDHRYPRPDNLQRHVRMHHEGKSKDDPALREVLNRRPNGSGHQSRRRRT